MNDDVLVIQKAIHELFEIENAMRRLRLGLGLSFILVYVLSFFIFLVYGNGIDLEIRFTHGAFVAYVGAPAGHEGGFVNWGGVADGWDFEFIIPKEWGASFSLPSFRTIYGLKIIWFPLWPFLAIVVGTLFAFGDLRRKPISDKSLGCKCGYLRKGNVSGICPECGSRLGEETIL